MDFEDSIYYACLAKGDVPAAMAYLAQFPEQTARLAPLERIFIRKQCPSYPISTELNCLLQAYQQYYRHVFYLRMEINSATRRLRDTLAEYLDISNENIDLDTVEQDHIAPAFQCRGMHFMGGKTEGYYGPYVWQTSEDRLYCVELPDGVQRYVVRMLDGFISKSWLDYISNGEISTGGWTDKDGIICCVASSYDQSSEHFQVSLLKHEAQHAMDLARWPKMQADVLEYRAKLVELIYSTKQNLLVQFLHEADPFAVTNSHALAACRIITGFQNYLNCDEAYLENLPIPQIQKTALALFQASK